MIAKTKVLLGICGGIAAYKAVEVVSRLRKLGAEVKVIMTDSATKFVTPLTFREMSNNHVTTSMWNEVTVYNVEHIALASWADVVIVAPATANIIAKMVSGIADDMLTTTLLATKAPIMVCPAMNTNMYENSITQKNIKIAKELGMHVMDTASGLMACGTSGLGRLPEPVDIVKELENFLEQKETMKNIKVLVTAGGTSEPIDPVRFIGNRSSGKMGYAIAVEAAKRGANVVLISGVSNLPVPEGVKIHKAETANKMRELVLSEYSDADIVIKAAAVADYRVENTADKKIKKKDDTLTLKLVKNPDILKELGKLKKKQYLVGFAAETNDLIENAQTKLKSKSLDMIVANDVSLPEAGFNHDTNIVKFIYPDGKIVNLEKMSKQEVAKKLLDDICEKIKK